MKPVGRPEIAAAFEVEISADPCVLLQFSGDEFELGSGTGSRPIQRLMINYCIAPHSHKK